MIKYGLLTADDEMASEHEVYDFLYALVRLLKPKVILETGTYKGGATKALARGARDNGIGNVTTCDTSCEYITEVAKECSLDRLPVTLFVSTGEEVCQKESEVNFAYIDSSGDRVEEVRNLNLAPGAVVVLHDSKRPQYKPIWSLRPWRAIWEIETEQGITVFQL